MKAFFFVNGGANGHYWLVNGGRNASSLLKKWTWTGTSSPIFHMNGERKERPIFPERLKLCKSMLEEGDKMVKNFDWTLDDHLNSSSLTALILFQWKRKKNNQNYRLFVLFRLFGFLYKNVERQFAVFESVIVVSCTRHWDGDNFKRPICYKKPRDYSWPCT